jgi:hypothetical protein
MTIQLVTPGTLSDDVRQQVPLDVNIPRQRQASLSITLPKGSSFPKPHFSLSLNHRHILLPQPLTKPILRLRLRAPKLKKALTRRGWRLLPIPSTLAT